MVIFYLMRNLCVCELVCRVYNVAFTAFGNSCVSVCLSVGCTMWQLLPWGILVCEFVGHTMWQLPPWGLLVRLCACVATTQYRRLRGVQCHLEPWKIAGCLCSYLSGVQCGSVYLGGNTCASVCLSLGCTVSAPWGNTSVHVCVFVTEMYSATITALVGTCVPA